MNNIKLWFIEFFKKIDLLSLQIFFQPSWYVQKYLEICNFEDATFVCNDHFSVGLLTFCKIDNGKYAHLHNWVLSMDHSHLTQKWSINRMQNTVQAQTNDYQWIEQTAF